MKKSKIFYITSIFLSIPIGIGIGLMGGLAQNYNEYNIIQKQVELLEEYRENILHQEVDKETKEYYLNMWISDAILNSILPSNKKDLLKKQKENRYIVARESNKLTKYELEFLKLETKLNYVYPKQDGFISGAILFTIGLSTAIVLLSLSFVFRKKEKINKDSDLDITVLNKSTTRKNWIFNFTYRKNKLYKFLSNEYLYFNLLKINFNKIFTSKICILFEAKIKIYKA